MRSWIVYGQLLPAVAFLLPLQVSGYTVTPNLLTLRTTGDESSAFLELENKEMKAAAVEITIQEHHKDIDGKTVGGKEADDDFIIYPSQLVMIPGDEVGVQLRWIGEPALSAERAYTLVTREVPIPRKAAEEPEPSTGIHLDVKILMNYEVRVYVTPPGAKPKVVVESVAERTQPAGSGPGTAESAQLEIILANQGTAHRSLLNMALVLVPLDPTGAPLTGRAVTLAARDVPAMKPHLLAGERRRLLIPRPAGLSPGPVRVTLSE
jgi:fimbrial chaperone protein